MQKINATITRNAVLRTIICKWMLNSFYGSIVLNPKVQSKYPSFENGLIKYRDHQRETLQGASENMDRFLYADTDSIHLIGTDPKGN